MERAEGCGLISAAVEVTRGGCGFFFFVKRSILVLRPARRIGVSLSLSLFALRRFGATRTEATRALKKKEKDSKKREDKQCISIYLKRHR